MSAGGINGATVAQDRPGTIDVSIILCTRNRSGVMPEAVRSISEAIALAPQLGIELILVDNGSSDDTLATAERLRSEAAFPMRVLVEPICGLSRAKNAGVRASRGDILMFTDDDCRLAPDYFRQLAAHYKGDDRPVVRGGRVELGDPSDLPFTTKTENKPTWYDGRQHPGGFVHGCNLTMAKSVIDLVGGFDERFGPGARFKAAEDTDLIYRAYLAGVAVQYVPDMAVYHFHGRRSGDEVRRLSRNYQIGNGALLAKNRLDLSLGRHLFWAARDAVRERFGGPKFDALNGISHADVALAQGSGVAIYLISKLDKAWRGGLPR